MRLKKIFLNFSMLLSISTLSTLAFTQEEMNPKVFCSPDFINSYNKLINSRKILANALQAQRVKKAKLMNSNCNDFYASYGSGIKCKAEVGDEITEISSDEHLLMCGLIKESVRPTKI